MGIKLISLWKSCDPVVKNWAEGVLLKTEDCRLAAAILEVARLNPDLTESQLKKNIKSMLHDGASISRLGDVIELGVEGCFSRAFGQMLQESDY